MKYLCHALPVVSPDEVILIPTDGGRDGPVEVHRVAGGTALEVVKALLRRLTPQELNELKLTEVLRA